VRALGRQPGRALVPLFGRRRLAALVVVGAVVGTYYALASHLPHASAWPDVAIASFGVIPAVLLLVLLTLPFAQTKPTWLLAIGVALIGVAVACRFAEWGLAGNWAKFWAPVVLGWWFLSYFESVWWVVLVACLVPFADVYSVFWGPTHAITQHREAIYFGVAFAFLVPPPPGQDFGAAHVGPPDLLFFALFLAAAARYGLRPGLTWLLMTASFGVQLVIAVGASVNGLPALPFLAAGFLLANGDLLWNDWRARRELGVANE
jgi:hypothetical protein